MICRLPVTEISAESTFHVYFWKSKFQFFVENESKPVFFKWSCAKIFRFFHSWFYEKITHLSRKAPIFREFCVFWGSGGLLGVWMKIKILKLCWRKWEKLVSRGSSTAKNPETNRTVTKNTFFKEGDEKCKTQAAKKSSFFHFNHARTRD